MGVIRGFNDPSNCDEAVKILYYALDEAIEDNAGVGLEEDPLLGHHVTIEWQEGVPEDVGSIVLLLTRQQFKWIKDAMLAQERAERYAAKSPRPRSPEDEGGPEIGFSVN